jgi:molybdate transport system substrate-binding protein
MNRRRLAVGVLVIGLVIGTAVASVAALARPSRAQLTVYAAASLTNVFPTIDSSERYAFGGSNMLAAQIQHGAPADVFASANTALPNELHAKGLCTKPIVFTRNALVIVVPKSNPAGVHSVSDLTKRGVRLVVAAPGVPVGSYTQQILKNLKLFKAVEKNVVSRETDVREVLSKVALGEADAGFVYSTDAKTVSRRVTTIKLPARAQPNVQYGICIVTASSHRTDAQAFVERVLSKAGQAKLLAAGFLPRITR